MLGEYELKEVLGRGSFATTYAAYHAETKKKYAIKVYRRKSMSQRAFDCLCEQTAAIQKLSYPQIDSVFDTVLHEDLYAQVKDLIHDGKNPAQNLYSLLERGPCDPQLALRILIQIAGALDFAYKNEKLIHGALRPGNILFAHWNPREELFPSDVDVKVSDFNPLNPFLPKELLFCLQGDLEPFNDKRDVKVQGKRAQILRGFYRGREFLAPEAELSMQSDMYILGLFAKKLLRGEYAFFHKLLAYDPKDRYENYDALLEELVQLIPQEALELPPTVKKESVQERELTPRGMVFIPPGVCFIGSPQCGQEATPRFERQSPGLYFDVHPVTVLQFERFLQETGYEMATERWKTAPYLPVTHITYGDALAYAQWKGRRLPTEFEWEYAAKGGRKDAQYPWGDTPSQNYANYAAPGPTPVMSYAPNGFGLYDMSGNVFEWTQSFFEPYPGSLAKNDLFGSGYRVARGGAFCFGPDVAQVSFRQPLNPLETYPYVGFRTCRD